MAEKEETTPLYEFRKAKRLSQLELANQIGINEKTYARYESDPFIIPGRVLLKLAKFYEVSIESLFQMPESESDFQIRIIQKVKKLNLHDSKLLDDFIILMKEHRRFQ